MFNRDCTIPALPVVAILGSALAVSSYARADDPGHSAADKSSASRSDSGTTDRPDRVSSGSQAVRMAMSAFDANLIAQLKDLWRSVASGNLPLESVILILRTGSGYQTQTPNRTNEYNESTFALQPNTIAIVHTHPNACSPTPSSGDIRIAMEHHLAMFTLSSRGMFVYDPDTRKTIRLMYGLDWLDPGKWSQSHQ